MKPRKIPLLSAAMIVCSLFGASRRVLAEPRQSHDEHLVRIAELEIDPAQIEAYKTALKEEIATSVRVEPGVLALYAVAVKDHPNQIRLFEIYRDEQAYQAHLQSPHFKKYKSGTQTMVKSLTLIETEPVLLGVKKR